MGRLPGCAVGGAPGTRGHIGLNALLREDMLAAVLHQFHQHSSQVIEFVLCSLALPFAHDSDHVGIGRPAESRSTLGVSL
jgi:hypothetical protein